jgi:FkbM family methyltransferase
MGFGIEDRLKDRLLPGWIYYNYKIAKEARWLEPELGILRDIVPAGRTVIDVGTNRGYYSYALSKIAARVEAFEPNPMLARFARRKLGPTIRLYEVALSNHAGVATLYIPQEKPGIDNHIGASLAKVHPVPIHREVTVHVATLDDYEFDDVDFIKIDVEGSDMDVIEGGQQTIARHRPNMLVELVAPTHADPLACVKHVKRAFGYQACIMVGGRFVDAEAALTNPPPRWTTRMVLFTPQ